MEHLEDILKLVERELGAVHNNGKFRSRDDIDSVYKLIDIAKDIYCIWEYEDEEDDASYDDGRSMRYDGESYARGRRGNVKRDSMGRYSRRYPMGYSRDGGKEEYIKRLREMMEDAPDEHTRSEIKRMVSQMESM
jgi:hypothetical protein